MAYPVRRRQSAMIVITYAEESTEDRLLKAKCRVRCYLK